jgi:hypothetical protein
MFRTSAAFAMRTVERPACRGDDRDRRVASRHCGRRLAAFKDLKPFGHQVAPDYGGIVGVALAADQGDAQEDSYARGLITLHPSRNYLIAHAMCLGTVSNLIESFRKACFSQSIHQVLRVFDTFEKQYLFLGAANAVCRIQVKNLG